MRRAATFARRPGRDGEKPPSLSRGGGRLALLPKAKDTQRLAEENHEENGPEDDGGVHGLLQDAGGDEQSGGEGGRLAGFQQQSEEDRERGGEHDGPDAQPGNAGAGDAGHIPCAGGGEGGEAGADGDEVAHENAVRAGAAALRHLDELIGGGAEAGEDEGLAAEPSGQGGDDEKKGFTQGSDHEIFFVRLRHPAGQMSGRRRDAARKTPEGSALATQAGGMHRLAHGPPAEARIPAEEEESHG